MKVSKPFTRKRDLKMSRKGVLIAELQKNNRETIQALEATEAEAEAEAEALAGIRGGNKRRA
jgi:hypothetical protein